MNEFNYLDDQISKDSLADNLIHSVRSCSLLPAASSSLKSCMQVSQDMRLVFFVTKFADLRELSEAAVDVNWCLRHSNEILD
jgi:hypothetical protein